MSLAPISLTPFDFAEDFPAVLPPALTDLPALRACAYLLILTTLAMIPPQYRVMSGRPTVCCDPARGTIASADASMVNAARSSGSRLWTLVLPQARAIIWHSMARVCRKL